MRIPRSHQLTREEKYALATALIVFALSIITVITLNLGSYLEVHQPEITVVISSNVIVPYFFSESRSMYIVKKEVQRIGTPRRKKPSNGLPVPVSIQLQDTFTQTITYGEASTDTSSRIASGGGLSPHNTTDSLILIYPGFRQFALREEMKKTRPKTRNDSLLAWAKENFVAQMSRHGKIDPVTLNQLMMLQQYQNSGPYHIITPGIGYGISFSYTTILKKIISIFGKAPED